MALLPNSFAPFAEITGRHVRNLATATGITSHRPRPTESPTLVVFVLGGVSFLEVPHILLRSPGGLLNRIGVHPWRAPVPFT